LATDGRSTDRRRAASWPPLGSLASPPTPPRRATLREPGRRPPRLGRAARSAPEPDPVDGEQHLEQEREKRRLREQQRSADRVRERQLHAARRELADADEALTAARTRATDQQSVVTDARRALAGPRRRIDELTAQLEQARNATAAAETVAAQAQRELAKATTAASEAHQRKSAALATLARLGEPAGPDPKS
jgi:chromosome segregation ATPase